MNGWDVYDPNKEYKRLVSIRYTVQFSFSSSATLLLFFALRSAENRERIVSTIYKVSNILPHSCTFIERGNCVNQLCQKDVLTSIIPRIF